MSPVKILVSAGEASGDLYAAELVRCIRKQVPEAEFFGCAGPKMQDAGVCAVVDASRLAVVGLVEVIAHIPRIYGEFRKLVAAAQAESPSLAILTDSPDFHLRLARKLARRGIPVVYLIAPQVWAWRESRVHAMRRSLAKVLCIFPFEEEYFRERGVPADYIGHPLTRIVRPSLSKDAFFQKHGLSDSRPLVTLLPGSRLGEVARHLPALGDAARLLGERAQIVMALPGGFRARAGSEFFRERIASAPIQVIEGETWDAIAHAEAALAASGTVTIEAALLGTPMATFYKVNPLSWWMGRFLVRVPFYSMVNLVAGRKIVAELMQDQASGDSLAAAVDHLLTDHDARERMKRELRSVAEKLSTREDPIKQAAGIVMKFLESKEPKYV